MEKLSTHSFNLAVTRIRGSGWVSLPSALLLFPFLTVFFSAIGFFAGKGVSAWWGFFALVLSAGMAWFSPNGKRAVFALLLLIAGAFCLNGLAVLYASADADLYHMPAIRLLAEGWNPLQVVAPEELAKFYPEWVGSRLGHVAFLPKATWLFSAVMYRGAGYAEAGNVLVILLAMALFGVLREALYTFWDIRGGWNKVLALGLTLSPWVIDNFFDATNDGCLYTLLLLAAFSGQLFLKTRENRWLLIALLVFPLLGNVKFTGAAACAVTVTVITLAGGGVRWLAGCVLAAALTLLIGVSPYLTSWKQYGSPVYPLFAGDVLQEHVLTADFADCNTDAEQMGYGGRFAYAYLSASLTKGYYRLKTGQERFEPELYIAQGGMEGLGWGFRLLMCLGVLGWILSGKHGRVVLPLGMILLLTSLLQPAGYVGYMRYVPQLYALPVVGLLAAFSDWKRRRWVFGGVALFQMVFCLIPLVWLGWKGMLTVQNLAVIRAFAPGEIGAHVIYPNIRAGFRDYGLVFRDPKPGEGASTASGSMLYTLYLLPDMPDPGIPPLRTNFDSSSEYLKSRNEKMKASAALFFHESLPWVVRELPRAFSTLVCCRFHQLRHSEKSKTEPPGIDSTGL